MKRGAVPMDSNDGDDEVQRLRHQVANLRRQVDALNAAAKRIFLEELAFSEFPAELQNDRQVVMQAIRKGRAVWRDLPDAWKDDVDLVCAVFGWYREIKTRDDAGLRCPFGLQRRDGGEGLARLQWSELSHGIATNARVVAAGIGLGEGPRWDQVPLGLRSCPEIAENALRHGVVAFEDLPLEVVTANPRVALVAVQEGEIEADSCICFESGDDFLRSSIQNGELDWGKLPSRLRDDVNFARSIMRVTSAKTPGQILEHFTALHNDVSFWYRVLDYAKGWIDDIGRRSEGKSVEFDCDKFHEAFDDYAAVTIRKNRKLMLDICEFFPFMFGLADSVLLRDESFIARAMENNPLVMDYYKYDPDYQWRLRHLVYKAIKNLKPDSRGDSFYCSLDRSFFVDRQFVEACLENDYKAYVVFCNRSSIEKIQVWAREKEFFLLAAKSSEGHRLEQSEFHGDPILMKEIVECNPQGLVHAHGDAAADPEVRMAAFAASSDFARKFLFQKRIEEDDDYIRDTLAYVRLQLESFRIFSEHVLGRMLSTQTVAQTGTKLTQLNQGIETSLKYKKRLAEYAGIPIGSRLHQLRAAERNILHAIAPWDPSA